ncbi:hypothetical protein N9L68_03150 [bacterium]|nr:hypothetical protein [bacterium]
MWEQYRAAIPIAEAEQSDDIVDAPHTWKGFGEQVRCSECGRLRAHAPVACVGASRSIQAAVADAAALNHSLLLLVDADRSRTLFCGICGCWALVKAQGLRKQCRGPPKAGHACAAQLARVRAGRHPSGSRVWIESVAVFQNTQVAAQLVLSPSAAPPKLQPPKSVALDEAEVRRRLVSLLGLHLEKYRRACGHSLYPDPVIEAAAPVLPEPGAEARAARRKERIRAWLNSLGYLNPEVTDEEAGASDVSE